MKLSLFVILVTLSSFAFAKADYSISKGKLHRGGSISVTSSLENDLAVMKINYKVNPVKIIPGFFKEYLQGDHVEKLPKEFLNETAYLDLEKNGTLEIKDANVFHQGRVTIGRYTNCHKVKIVAKNGKSEIIAYYHPIVSDAGWVKINLTIKKIPVLSTYNLEANIID